jgi:hypothetical protein
MNLHLTAITNLKLQHIQHKESVAFVYELLYFIFILSFFFLMLELDISLLSLQFLIKFQFNVYAVKWPYFPCVLQSLFELIILKAVNMRRLSYSTQFSVDACEVVPYASNAQRGKMFRKNTPKWS